MRFTQLIFPLALIGNVLAATETGSDEGTTAAATGTGEATTKATATATGTGKATGSAATGTITSGTKATATGTKSGDNEGDSTATGTDDGESGSTTKTTTAQRFNTDEWVPTIPATTAPDLNGATSLGNAGFLGLTVAAGVISIGMVLL